jgi:hypothetical protein
MLNLSLLAPLIVVLASANDPAAENPVFQELLDKGVKMSDGTMVKLPPPILADGLDAAAQRAALTKAGDARSPVAELVKKQFSAPVLVKVRTVRPSEGEGPAVRKIDLWFVAHGDWNVLTSKDFLETALKTKEEGSNRTVLQSGVLTDQEKAARKLSATVKDNYEEQFVYATFRLFERVELSATRFSVLTRGKDSILAAGRLDPRFRDDPKYPNQWRPLVRDERAEIKPGPPHPFPHAGGYAKITRLLDPADGVLVECHLVYEESYGWFDGLNLVKQKAPVMVQEKVRTFRRKLALASGEKSPKSDGK